MWVAVPLSHAVGDPTIQEQENELASTYSMSPITLIQAALNHIFGSGDGKRGPTALTPVFALKPQPFPNLQPVDSRGVNSPSRGAQAPSDTLLINLLPADQKVIVEHIVKHDVALSTHQRVMSVLWNFSQTLCGGGLWHMAAVSYSNNPLFQSL